MSSLFPQPAASHTFVSTNLLMVARMSWCPDTSSRVSGRYFSTLSRHFSLLQWLRDALCLPWQAVFCFHGKIGGASLAFRVCVVGTEHHGVSRGGRIEIHIIFVVRHIFACKERVQLLGEYDVLELKKTRREARNAVRGYSG